MSHASRTAPPRPTLPPTRRWRVPARVGRWLLLGTAVVQAQVVRPLVDDLEAGLDVTVNPRFGTLEDGSVVAGDGGVVQILSGDDTTDDAADGAAAGD